MKTMTLTLIMMVIDDSLFGLICGLNCSPVVSVLTPPLDSSPLKSKKLKIKLSLKLIFLNLEVKVKNSGDLLSLLA